MPPQLIEPPGRVRTKIVATVGPACNTPGMLDRLVRAGVDLFRLNFSHATHDEHARNLELIRRLAKETEHVVGVLQDLGGPKIRLGTLPGDAIDCHEGDLFTLSDDPPTDPDDPRHRPSTYPGLADELKPGEVVYLADGVVAMQVVDVTPGRARLEVTLPGRIRSRQGINLPGSDLKVSALTPKDLIDLDWAARHPVDYIGLSFVRTAQDVKNLRRELEIRGISARILAKIEKPQAVANLASIVQEADAIMVARGDLGVEMEAAQVPAAQKQIIAECHRARVPVITATQMLASMEASNRPTRAEATDVFNAILDGTDAVMLSGETAIGIYPVEAVATMSAIAREAEALLATKNHWTPPPPSSRLKWITPITESVVEAASSISRTLRAALVVVVTESGRSALAMAKCQNPALTLAITDNLAIARGMTLFWGVTPLYVPSLSDHHEETLRVATDWARTHNLIQPGDRVVLVRGVTPDSPVHNALLVHEER
jgi:pyruvate kinase